MKTYKYIVSGSVQGVGFRMSTFSFANNLGLKGYVLNLDDGTVEVVVKGNHEKIDEFEKWLNTGGPKFAVINHIKRTLLKNPEKYKEFHVL